MATEFEAEVKGLRELSKVLAEFPDRLERNVMRGAVRAGTKVLQQTAARKARLATSSDGSRGDRGRLADNIIIATRRGWDNELIGGLRVKSRRYVTIRPTRRGGYRGVVYNPARLWHLFEFGTAERTQIKFKNKPRRTGFIASRPFLRPTAREKANETVTAMQRYLERRIDRETRKLAAAILSVQTS